MNTTATKNPSTDFFSGSKIISEPDAALTVRELTLTERGRQALTSGSSGIMQGAQKTPTPSSLPKKTVHA